MSKSSIVIVGPGVMGKAILSSLITTGLYQNGQISIAGPNTDRNSALAEEYGITVFTNNQEAVANADIVILSIKPQRFKEVAKDLKGSLKKDALIISIIAGISMKSLTEKTGSTNIVRAMPNTPSQIRQGITVWAKSAGVSSENQQETKEILSAFGEEVFVEDEMYLDMATALSGTGPAYVFLFMEALIDAGVHLGFPRRIAEKLVLHNVIGSAEFFKQNKEHPAKLRNEVTSPGGTSAEALYYLEKAGFRTAISRAVWAAYQRSIELGKGINKTDKESNNEVN
jgi:pyrroline-5-carboxylate reductase